MKSIQPPDPGEQTPTDDDPSPAGRLVMDAFGTVLEANAAAAALFGCPMDQLVGNNIGHFIAPDKLPSSAPGHGGGMHAMLDGPQMLSGLRGHGEAFALQWVLTQSWSGHEARFTGVLAEVPPAPGQTASAAPTAPCEPPAEMPALRPLHILMAEDHPVNQMVAGMLLTQLGHSHVPANNGQEALDLHAAQAFDLILMDVVMPVMDGLAAMAAVRAREAGTGRRTPIVVVTAHAMAGDRERFLATGADGYVSKPILGQALQAEMRRVIEAAGAHAVVSQASPNLLSPSPDGVD